MRFTKVIASAVATVCLTATVAFAAPEPSQLSGTKAPQQKNDTLKSKKVKGLNLQIKDSEKCRDPIKALENRKQRIQAKLKEGKITEEKAKDITKRIDARIKEIKEFNGLTVQQKRDKLISNFKAVIEKKVKAGRISPEKGKELMAEFTEKVQKWDGNGYPQFHSKRFKKEKERDLD